MTTHTPELVMALSCLSGLLALLACVVWQGPVDRAIDALVARVRGWM
jgi:hypothetical protein